MQPASTSGQSLPDRAVFKRKRQQQAGCIDPEGQHEASKGAAAKAGSACSAAPQVEAEQQERQEQHQEVAAEAPAIARRASPGRGKSRESASQPRSKSQKASKLPPTEASLLISEAPKPNPLAEAIARAHAKKAAAQAEALASKNKLEVQEEGEEGEEEEGEEVKVEVKSEELSDEDEPLSKRMKTLRGEEVGSSSGGSRPVVIDLLAEASAPYRVRRRAPGCGGADRISKLKRENPMVPLDDDEQGDGLAQDETHDGGGAANGADGTEVMDGAGTSSAYPVPSPQQQQQQPAALAPPSGAQSVDSSIARKEAVAVAERLRAARRPSRGLVRKSLLVHG